MMSNDPFEPPATFDGSNLREVALGKVKTPALLLLITGILSILGSIFLVIYTLAFPAFLQTMLTQMRADPNVPADAIQQLESQASMLETMSPFYLVSAVVGLIGAVVMIIGSSKMKKLEGYGLSMTACILAIVPFTSPCCSCIFPLVAGIWGIIVLADQDVKSQFS